MGDKPIVIDSKTLDAEALGTAAKAMAREIIADYSDGVGDTVPAAAGRASDELKVDIEILLQGWSRPAREMYVSRWMRLFLAWRRHRLKKAKGWNKPGPPASGREALDMLAQCLSLSDTDT